MSPSYRKGVDRTEAYTVLTNGLKAYAFGTIYAFPIGRETKMAIFSQNRTNQPTATKAGRKWATTTLLICGAFTIWAQYDWPGLPDWVVSVIVAVFPPIVSFITSHLISYLNPKTKWTKGLIYGGFGAIIVTAMAGSAMHILRTVHDAGQPWHTAWTYIFLADAPMLLAGVVLSIKVSGTAVRTIRTSETKDVEPAKVKEPIKKAVPAKTTKPAVKRTTPAKAVKPSQATSVPAFSSKSGDS